MSASSKCPTAADLRELLDGASSSNDPSSIVSHLDHCPGCQQSLEALAAGDSALVQSLKDQPSALTPDSQSAYWPALRQAEMALTVEATDTPRSRHEVSLDFLDPPADGSHLGSLAHFNVIRVVGQGGMGVVLHAVDTCLERDVAIKVLDPDLADDELARTRFCREARAAAQISHENVVAVHQVEHEEGKDLPFLVMELITGESLEKKIDREGRLPLREIVSIGMQTAAGLAAAHEKNLIHRDIKPGNILLEKSGQRVKLTDFGLARAAEDVRLTRSGLVAGTPLYMSPEQARGDDLDARSDLFSLGVVLYELAAGEPPFSGKTPLMVLKRLTEEQPQPLRQRNPEIPEWFANIVDKLLAKNPKDRFQSAREVASTLEHFWALLKSTDTLVCPKKKSATMWKSIGLGAVAGLVCGALGLFLLMPQRDRPEEKIPQAANVFKGSAGPLWSMAITKDGKNLATGTDDGSVRFWDIAGERVLWTLNAHPTPIWALAVSPAGDYLATGSDDGITKIWDLATQKEVADLPKIGSVRSLAISPDGKHVLIGGRDGTVKVWDIATKKDVWAITGHTSLVAAVAFSPDGKSIASAGADRTIKVWDAATGQLTLTLTGHESGVYAIAFSPKDAYLASGGWDHTVRLWDLNSGSQLAKLKGHTQDVWSVAFDPEGKLLASTGEDQMVRVWDVESKKQVAAFRASTGTVLSVRFAADPGLIIAAGKDGTARAWSFPAVIGGEIRRCGGQAMALFALYQRFRPWHESDTYVAAIILTLLLLLAVFYRFKSFLANGTLIGCALGCVCAAISDADTYSKKRFYLECGIILGLILGWAAKTLLCFAKDRPQEKSEQPAPSRDRSQGATFWIAALTITGVSVGLTSAAFFEMTYQEMTLWIAAFVAANLLLGAVTSAFSNRLPWIQALLELWVAIALTTGVGAIIGWKIVLPFLMLT